MRRLERESKREEREREKGLYFIVQMAPLCFVTIKTRLRKWASHGLGQPRHIAPLTMQKEAIK